MNNAAILNTAFGKHPEHPGGEKLAAALESLRPCKLCGMQTSGSVGAAGLRWLSICQPCKDQEDAIQLAGVRAIAAFPRGVSPFGVNVPCPVCSSQLVDTNVDWECSNPDCEHREDYAEPEHDDS